MYLLGFICNKFVAKNGATRNGFLCIIIRVKLTSQLALLSC